MWKTFHDTTLVNATLGAFLLEMNAKPDVISKYFLHVALTYLNDPALPIEHRFKATSTFLVPYTEPTIGSIVLNGRAQAIEMGRKELGAEYWATCAYFLSVRFGEEEMAVPFWKYFAIDKARGRAKRSCEHPFELMERYIHEGVKLRFCCGREEGMATCCCEGTTH